MLTIGLLGISFRTIQSFTSFKASMLLATYERESLWKTRHFMLLCGIHGPTGGIKAADTFPLFPFTVYDVYDDQLQQPGLNADQYLQSQFPTSRVAIHQRHLPLTPGQAVNSSLSVEVTWRRSPCKLLLLFCSTSFWHGLRLKGSCWFSKHLFFLFSKVLLVRSSAIVASLFFGLFRIRMVFWYCLHNRTLADLQYTYRS